MIVTSTVVMFALMYLNTCQLDHVFWSETCFYAALFMGAAMAIIMLAYMLGMSPKYAVNAGTFVGSVSVITIALSSAQPGHDRRRGAFRGHDPASLDRRDEQARA